MKKKGERIPWGPEKRLERIQLWQCIEERKAQRKTEQAEAQLVGGGPRLFCELPQEGATPQWFSPLGLRKKGVRRKSNSRGKDRREGAKSFW